MEIIVDITQEDFLNQSSIVKVVYKKLKGAGIPINPIGVTPVVREGELFREEQEDKVTYTWISS